MKKTTMRNFKKILSLICSLALVLGVSIPALTASAAGFGEAPYAYPNPIIPSSSTTTFNFDNASEYKIANQADALYLSYYKQGGVTVPSGTTAEITDGKLKFSSGLTSGTSIQSWVINKNGAPYELIPGHSYTVTFDFEQAGTVALANDQRDPFVSLSAGIATHDWTFKADNDNGTYNLGASASVMPSGNYTYHNDLINGSARTNGDIANTAIYKGNINKVMHGYKGWPSVGSKKTVSYSFVAYYMNDSRVKNYLAFTFGLNAGQAFTIDNFQITDNDFVRETDELSAENDSITYDFANADDYVLDNSGDEPYWSRYYGLPFQAYAEDGSRIVHPVEHNLAVNDGALVIKSGVDDIDFSQYSAAKDTVTAYTAGQQRSLTSWIINKNGKPIEIKPGMDYKISVKFKSYETAPAQTFVSVANGVAYDDVKQQYWWSNFGGNASVMAEKAGTVYTYTNSNTAPTTNTGYPNNAVFYGRYNAIYSNHLIDVLENTATADNTTKTKNFTAYDITENGTANRKNYLALDFCLSPGQTIEIEEITVTYDYSKVTNVTYNFDDGTTKSVIADVNSSITETATKEGYDFVGWVDEDGTTYTTVPAISGGKLALYPVFKIAPIVLDDVTQNQIVFDFANPDEYTLTNPEEGLSKYLSFFRPATNGSTANADYNAGQYNATDLRNAVIAAQSKGETVQIVNDETKSANVLKLTSGLPDDVGQSAIQSWVLNKNGKPIEIEPGEYYTVSVQYREAKAPTAKNAKGLRPMSFISISNGIAFDDTNKNDWWTEFSATASVMGDNGAAYTYISSSDTHTLTTADDKYPNSAVALWNENFNSIVWADADEDFTTDTYTTKEKNFLAYDITEDGTNAKRNNYLALTFAVAGGQEIYIDTITVTKVNKLSFDTFGNGDLGYRYLAAGTRITLPTPEAAEGKKFIAWSNEDLRLSYADIFTMPAENVTLHALYDSAQVTVDPDNDYDIIDSCDNFDFDDDNNFIATGSESAKLAISNTSGSGNYYVANGGAYKIAFKYQLVGNSAAASINAYTTKLGERNYKEANSYSLEATASDNWQDGELIVVLKPDYYIADGQYCLANALYLGVDGLDSEATFKIDTVTVTALDEPILTVDYNLGDNKVEHKTNVQLDTPENEGFVFGGWYDSLSQEEFTIAEIAENKTVYADWITEFIVGDVNADGDVNILDLIRIKKISLEASDDAATNKRVEIYGGPAESLVVLKRILLDLDTEIPNSTRISGIAIDNYCVDYEDGTNILLNEAVASLKEALGNPEANDDFKIVVSSDADKAEGIYVDGNNLVINSADTATLISYVNQIVRTISRYDGKYNLGFNENVSYDTATLNKSEYALVFGDEFDADSLSNLWTTPKETTSGLYKDADGNEVQNYQLGNIDPIAIENGTAFLTDTAVLDENGIPEYFKYQNIVSDFTFTYGYLETRVKIAETPATTSLWLRGAQRSQETDAFPEFDMCETINGDDIVQANIHAFKFDGQHFSLDQSGSEFVDDGILDFFVKDKDYECPDGRWSDEYHVFALKWDAQSITYYLDGKEYFTYTFEDSFLDEKAGADTFRQPVNLLLSTRMGSLGYGPVWEFGDLASTSVEIDYVRLYQSEKDGGNLNGILK